MGEKTKKEGGTNMSMLEQYIQTRNFYTKLAERWISLRNFDKILRCFDLPKKLIKAKRNNDVDALVSFIAHMNNDEIDFLWDLIIEYEKLENK